MNAKRKYTNAAPTTVKLKRTEKIFPTHLRLCDRDTICKGGYLETNLGSSSDLDHFDWCFSGFLRITFLILVWMVAQRRKRRNAKTMGRWWKGPEMRRASYPILWHLVSAHHRCILRASVPLHTTSRPRGALVT